MSTPSPTFDPVGALLGLINQINPDLPSKLTTSNVSLGQPQVMAASNNNVNTSLVLTAVAGQGYGDKASVYYYRQDITAYMTAGGVTAPTLDAVGVTDWPSFFAVFNARYNTSFSSYDYPGVPFALPALAGESMAVPMPPSSLLFTGTLEVVVTNIIQPALSTVVTVTNLGGLIPPPSLKALVANNITPGLKVSHLLGQPVKLGDFISENVIDGLLLSQLRPSVSI